jgi:hypothetical protein
MIGLGLDYLDFDVDILLIWLVVYEKIFLLSMFSKYFN